MLTLAAGTAVGFVVGWGAQVLVRRARTGWRRLDSPVVEVYIGHDALYVNGGVFVLGSSAGNVCGAELKAGSPAVLVLSLRNLDDDRWCVPVPVGREAEAEQVARELIGPV